jgi:hypothetical protein
MYLEKNVTKVIFWKPIKKPMKQAGFSVVGFLMQNGEMPQVLEHDFLICQYG